MRRLGLTTLLAVLLLSACGSGGDELVGPDAGLDPVSPSVDGTPTSSPPGSAPPGSAPSGSAPSGSAPSGSPGGEPSTPSSTALGPDRLLPDPTLPPTGRSVTVSGLVTDGVEAGCLLLDSGGTVYLLLGAPADAAGQEAEVTGTLAPDTLSTCQQGVALKVSSLRSTG